MGRVRTKTVKKAAKVIIEKYYTRLTLDYHTNKRICEEVAIIPTKPLRNKIAGYVTHLMGRLRHSQVRGISIKLQEEERERRDNYVPAVSALEQDIIECPKLLPGRLFVRKFVQLGVDHRTVSKSHHSWCAECGLCSLWSELLDAAGKHRLEAGKNLPPRKYLQRREPPSGQEEERNLPFVNFLYKSYY
ncbi:unnamed protein product [Hermetia illucens]|uniref:Small ribosomal subunit protein eS17 n=24 Tax=Brachycera TaxID=7203 RepID=A0A7R8YRD0_HERIL|nr:unnamed protein product [Hermetia illucens]